MSVLFSPEFHDETEAYWLVEAIVWPHGPVCPHCGENKRARSLNGKSTRIGVYKCYACRKPFTVKIGTLLQSSHIPLHKWLQAICLLRTSKNRISPRQLGSLLSIQARSALSMSDRIRGAGRPSWILPFATIEEPDRRKGQSAGTTDNGSRS